MIKFTNNAATIVPGAIAASDITITVAPGTGAEFPVLTAPDYCYATILRPDETFEIVKVTGRNRDMLTVARGQDNTAAQDFAAGARIELRLNAGAIQDIIAAAGSVLSVAGKTGNVTLTSADLTDFVDPVGVSIVFGS